MAYAGICGADNIQPNSDPYFHSRSFDQIVAHITGAGNCAVSTATGNTPAGGECRPQLRHSRQHALRADRLGHRRQQRRPDLLLGAVQPGPGRRAERARRAMPRFSDFFAPTSPTRTFPRLSDILNNTQTNGELLPTYGRRLIFRLVARDNRAGGGGVDYDSMHVVVVAHGRARSW